MDDTTAEETVSTLHSLFAHLGLPDQIVSDNGPKFIAEAFRKFKLLMVLSMLLVHPTTR